MTKQNHICSRKKCQKRQLYHCFLTGNKTEESTHPKIFRYHATGVKIAFSLTQPSASAIQLHTVVTTCYGLAEDEFIKHGKWTVGLFKKNFFSNLTHYPRKLLGW